MNEVYIILEKVTDNKRILRHFKKDLVSIDDLLALIDELDYEVEMLEDEIKDIKQDMEDNYKTRYNDPYSEYGVSESDFH